MKKRFTDTEKWSNPWFRKLTPTQKLFWLYLCDRCDNSGVIDIDEELATFQIGEDVTMKDMLPMLGHRVTQIESGKFWIENFVDFQCGKLSMLCKPHVYVIKLLQKHGVWLDYLKGTPYPTPTLSCTPKEEEEETDKEKHKDTEEDCWNGTIEGEEAL